MLAVKDSTSIVPKIGILCKSCTFTWNTSDSSEQVWLEIREVVEGRELYSSVVEEALKAEDWEAMKEKSLIFDYV